VNASRTACVLLACVGAAAQAPASPFTERELAAVLSLSPLPPPPRDSTNRVDGDVAAIALGKILFFEPRLSSNRSTACSTCHDPALSWIDGKPVAVAAAAGKRNTPALWNVAHNRWFFWDGRADSLWSQALKPLEDSAEMGGARVEALNTVAGDAALRARYEAVFGPLPNLGDAARFPPRASPLASNAADLAAWWSMASADRETVSTHFANLGKAIAAYVATITTGPAPFDRFVADLRTGRTGSRAISESAQNGLRIFIGKGNCVLCHGGPSFTNKEFHDTRVRGGAADDAGRADGAARLLADEFIAAGPYSDDTEGARAQQLYFFNGTASVLGHFKTPTLRNVALTAPYMHAGQLATLADVVRHYSTLADAAPPADPGHVEALITPMNLGDEEIADVVAFLESLTSEQAPAPEAPDTERGVSR
jgi:cytochrome c peroxidase